MIDESQKRVLSHYWVTSYPNVVNLISLTALPSYVDEKFTVKGTIYDSDGYIANVFSIEIASRQFVLEADPLLGDCKLESGFKQAHLELETPLGIISQSRIQGRENAAIMGELSIANGLRGTFFPVTISSDVMNFICIVNTLPSESTLRGRFFVGKRSPEAGWSIPGKAARMLCIEEEFRHYLTAEDEESKQAYIRLGTKSGELGLQFITRMRGTRDVGYYYSVS